MPFHCAHWKNFSVIIIEISMVCLKTKINSKDGYWMVTVFQKLFSVNIMKIPGFLELRFEWEEIVNK